MRECRSLFWITALAGALIGFGACGDDDGGEVYAPPIADGEPLPAFADGDWHWVPVEGARCRDGSPTGLGVRYGTANKLLIYFRGGGICFDPVTCSVNPSSFGAEDMADWQDTTLADGIFTDESPLADWSQVFLPYCTGDAHAGHRAQVAVDGVDGLQDFVGGDDFELDMARILPTFRGVDRVLVIGTSAGGLGATLHYETIVRSFPPGTAVDLVIDSGPLLPEAYFPPCFQGRLRELYAMDPPPEGCEGCLREDGGGLDQLAPYLLERWSQHRFAWILSQRDYVLRILYGYGKPSADAEACGAQSAMEESWFGAALTDLIASFTPYDNASWWLVDDTQHTWLQGHKYFDKECSGVLLEDFFCDFVDGGMDRVVP